MARNYQFKWAFSPTKQSAYGTPLADGVLTTASYIQGPDLAQRTPSLVRDNGQFGRGDEWARTQEIDVWDLALARKMDLNPLLAGLFAGFGLGAVTTTTPLAGVYQHVFKPIDSLSTLQLPAMTVVEEAIANTGVKKKIQDLVVNDFEISGEGRNRLQIAANLKGSGQWANSTLAMPAPAAGGFLRMKDGLFELGPFGGAFTNMSSLLERFSVKWNNNLADEDGYILGSGFYRGRHEIGLSREPSFDFDLLQVTDGQELDRLDANTNLKARLTFTGGVISGAHNFTLIIDMPDLHYKTVEKFYTGEGKLAYKISCNLNYDDTGGVLCPLFITVKNDVAVYL